MWITLHHHHCIEKTIFGFGKNIYSIYIFVLWRPCQAWYLMNSFNRVLSYFSVFSYPFGSRSHYFLLLWKLMNESMQRKPFWGALEVFKSFCSVSSLECFLLKPNEALREKFEFLKFITYICWPRIELLKTLLIKKLSFTLNYKKTSGKQNNNNEWKDWME